MHSQPSAKQREKTKQPGIWRNHQKDCPRHEVDGKWKGRCTGRCSYLLRFRPGGRGSPELNRSYDRLEDAERAKLALRDHARGRHERKPDECCPLCEGEHEERERPTLHEYAREHIERYQGTGKRGYRQETRDEERRLLERYALRYFDSGKLLDAVKPRDIADFLGWLTRRPSRRGGTLSDSSIRNALKPLAACFATARREGLIEHNPCDGAVLPHRPRVEEDDDGVQPFPLIKLRKADGEEEEVETMELVVSLVRADHRLLFEVLAATGVRRSELLALLGRDLHLDGAEPHIAIRRRVRRQRGNGLVTGPLKSKHARRNLPIPLALADKLRALRRGPDELGFQSQTGGVIDPDNLHERILRPACSEAGVEWAGFHTFRHTLASRLFADGRNVVQVQRWLGHHSPSFTLDTYVHLLSDDLGGALESRTDPAQGAPEGTTERNSEERDPASCLEETTLDQSD